MRRHSDRLSTISIVGQHLAALVLSFVRNGLCLVWPWWFDCNVHAPPERHFLWVNGDDKDDDHSLRTVTRPSLADSYAEYRTWTPHVRHPDCWVEPTLPYIGYSTAVSVPYLLDGLTLLRTSVFRTARSTLAARTGRLTRLDDPCATMFATARRRSVLLCSLLCTLGIPASGRGSEAGVHACSGCTSVPCAALGVERHLDRSVWFESLRLIVVAWRPTTCVARHECRSGWVAGTSWSTSLLT